MRRTMMALIIFATTILGLYLVDVIFGSALDQMYVTFNATQSIYNLTPGWSVVANAGLARWQMIYNSITVITIAVGVWVVLTIIGVEDYTRQW